MAKKLKYFLIIFSLIRDVSNWYQIFFLFLYKHEAILKLRDGTKFKINHYLDTLTIKEIYIEREYDIKLNNPKNVIDIGANIGTFSVYIAQKYPQSKIYSYEPANETYKLLEYNIKINGVKNVAAKKLAVSNRLGFANFYTYAASGLSSLSNKRKGAVREKVKLTTLGEIFKAENLRSLDLIKMDTEGAEYEILMNAPDNILSKVKNIVLEYHDSLTKYKHKDIIKFLKSKNFKIKVKRHSIENDIGIIYATR